MITADVAPLWDRPEDFVIWGDTARGTPYNGSMFLLTAGARSPSVGALRPGALARVCEAARVHRQRPGVDRRVSRAARAQVEHRRTACIRFAITSTASGATCRAGARVVIFHGRFDPWMPAVQAQHQVDQGALAEWLTD